MSAVRDCEHVENTNPRHEGWCVKCGHRMPVPISIRSSGYEQAFLDDIQFAAERRHGVPTDGFTNHVKARLAMGAGRYGDEAFLSKDVLRELQEEAWDMAAYALLEAQKRLADGDQDVESAWRLYEIAMHAAAAHGHAQAARSESRD